MNVTVRNVITSMRHMSAVDWAEFFESVSLVDAELRAGSDFALMDFPTRDRYRHAIEVLARGSGYSELDVAGRALLAAKRAAGQFPILAGLWINAKSVPFDEAQDMLREPQHERSTIHLTQNNKHFSVRPEEPPSSGGVSKGAASGKIDSNHEPAVHPVP